MINTMLNTMLTSATQQRNSQGNLQGNSQSETPPISIETSPIAPIIDAATIFSLRFTARMKRIGAILIMSALMVFLSACGGGGGGGVPPGGETTSSIGVLNLKVYPNATNATLTWSNPNANITKISIIYQNTTADSVEGQINITEITDSNSTRPNANVTKVITGLTNGTNYTFSVTLELGGADGSKSVMAAEMTRLIGPNLDRDEYADADPLELDIDGDDVNNTMDAFPSDPNESVDTDGDTVGDNADVDADGDGLIEIATAQQLNQSRHNLLGSNFTRSAGGVGDANGCGNGTTVGEDVTACNGYELIADIYLTTYTNWQPIGSCPTFIRAVCTPVNKLFNATFDGNNHTINDLTITNPAGDYANAAGLFGAISSDSILRNIHIRSGNISDGGHNVGLLVGYAARAMIINSSAEGAVNASGDNVGGLVGYGFDATITSSHAAGGAVSGDGFVGGLVGAGESATITSSYAAGGAVRGDGNNVGGLVGNGLRGTITSSYAAGGSVSGDFGVGGLVGTGQSATITSSYAAGGDVSGDGDNVGGLVGDGANAEITSSYAAGGAVSGRDNVGGLVGYGAIATITSSYAAGGAVSGDDDVGGLVGSTSDAFGRFATITASYWDNSVTIIPSAGNSHGLPKTTSELQAPAHATGIYATWTSSCPGANKPAWYFGNSTQYPVLTCHPNSDSDRDGVPDIIDTDDDGDGTLDTADDLPLNPTERVDTDEDGVGDNTDAFLEDPTESADTDEDGVGDNADACDGVGAATDWTSDATTDKDGDGCRDSDEDVDDNGDGLIEIRDDTELDQVRDDLSGRSFAGDSAGCGGLNDITACNGYELTQNISLADYSDWQPIGGCPTLSSGRCADLDALFNTTFDGKDYIISNLTITNSNGDYDNASGLFGAISSTSILRNIHIRSGNISDGGRNVGLLVGYARGEDDNIRPSIINSSAEGAVNASGNNVGGLVGFGFGANITSSYAAGGSVSGDHSVGGLVGNGQDAEITSSYAAGGAVSGTAHNVGGLVGDGRDSTVTSSYAAGGDVSGTGNAVGGLVGDGDGATITSSYAAGGAVSGDGDIVGGLVGNGDNAEITSSYAAGGAVSGDFHVGGLVGFGQDAEITSSYAAGGAVSGASNVGGLVGYGGGSTITFSYWDRQKSRRASSGGGESKTTQELKTGADDIYFSWASGTCADGSTLVWDFGTASDYPALRCTPNGLPAQLHLRQR